MKFPKDFLFGSAISDYQHFGYTPCELKPRKTSMHLELYKRDFELIEELGLNCFRTALEWGRVFPKPDKVNYEYLEFFKGYLAELKDRKIEVFLTLHHFTNPKWTYKFGGWASSKTLKKFLEYVELASYELKGLVDYYLLTNEPFYVSESYITGYFPPNEKLNLAKAFSATKNFLLAIKLGSRIISKNDKKAKAKVSFTHNFPYIPITNPLAKLVDWVYEKFLKVVIDEIDFIALNYYSKMFIPISPFSFNQMERIIEYYPQGLGFMCKRLFEKFRKPIILTENGFPGSPREKSVALAQSLFQISKTIKANVPIKGYLWWSFLHGYEWFIGYKPNFGLVDVNFSTLKRRINEAGITFKQIIEGKLDFENFKTKKLRFKGWPSRKYKEVLN